MPHRYIPRTTDDLRRLKDELGRTGDQMAELFGLGGGHQWRKYTGGDAPREMGATMLFFGAAQLVLEPAQLQAIVDRMQAMGGTLQLRPDES
jgi:hypothetical protein